MTEAETVAPALEIQDLLGSLDALLRDAVATADAELGPAAPTDRWRGLYIESADAQRLLQPDQASRPDRRPRLSVLDRPSRLRTLSERFSLTEFETQALLIVLAPDIDVRYERLYAYLQDDVTRRRPTVDLVTRLLCTDAQDRLEKRRASSASSRLLSSGLLDLVSDPAQPCITKLSRSLAVDERIVGYVLGDDTLDPRLERVAVQLVEMDPPHHPPTAAGPARAVAALVREAGLRARPAMLYLHGGNEAARRQAARQASACVGAPLLEVSLGRLLRALDELAGRFDFAPDRIRQTVSHATRRARARVAAGRSHDAELPTLSDLVASVRDQTNEELQRLARRIESHAEWDALVVPPDQAAQLREICAHARRRRMVLEQWGFGGRLPLGRGLAVLFAGPSGTGKTLAAGIVAGALGLDLYRIDLSRVVSKYIGETERNLDRVFAAATGTPVVLFFDEADALFGRRSEVNDAHDRYANIEVGYLLQKLEEFEGIVILATNLRGNMDEAFARRMQFSVEFPLPDEVHRRRIWERHLPRQAPRAGDIDFDFLARQFRLTGGNIRNAMLAGAVLAADEGSPISMRHLVRSVRRELQKIGRTCSESEFGAFYAEAIAT